MIINHKIYGRHVITESVLIELIKSKSLQRLKEIDNNGPRVYHYSSPGRFSRYNHSIGVMLLLRKFNASLEEQIAGLLHDISHTAFSHVADFVFERREQHDYQDSKLAQAFKIQGINKILKKYKINPRKILNEKNFPLLERTLPALCADRIDYTLQDALGKKLYKIDRKLFLENLAVYKNQFVFKDKIWAKRFGLIYLKLNQNSWCCPLQVAIYQITADAINLALGGKIITKKDLFTTDKFLMKKLKTSKNPEIIGKIKSLKNLEVKIVKEKNADICVKSKIRIVDPPFIKNNKLVRLASADKNYKKKITAWGKKTKKGFCIKILNQ